MRYMLTILLTAIVLAAPAQVIYDRKDSVTVCRLLHKSTRTTSPLWFARRLHGVPYVAHTLEVGSREQLVVNTRQLDCTTLVETVTALTVCAHQGRKRWTDYLDVLRQLRYRQGRIDGYTSRLHYFTDWIADNTLMQYVSEIQQPDPPFTALQVVDATFMSSHPQYYQALRDSQQLVDVIRRQEAQLCGQTYRYIPKQQLERDTPLLRQTIRDGDIIAITTSKKGLEIAHLGFAVWQRDGLHLLNASQLHKKVVTEPMTLGRYLQKHPSHTGIRVIRIIQ